MKTKNIYIALMGIFLLAGLIFGGIFIHQYNDGQASADAFNELEQLVVEETEPADASKDSACDVGEIATEEELPEEDQEMAEAIAAHEKYQALFEQNDDFIGWISIADTKVNYPVMQSVDRPDFYLNHAFDKSYSSYGVPYADESCVTGLSDNIVVYGHNMKNGSMFSDLVKYASKEFWETHPVIRFDTMSRISEYEVVEAFRFDTNNETFRFNEYTDMNEAEFSEFWENCQQRQLYDTGIEIAHGDELLTLSTCEYTYKNGRFIVVARKIGE